MGAGRHADIVDSIAAEYRRYKTLADAALAQLDDPDLSRPGSNGSNSIAVLVWHVSGNLASRFTEFRTSDGEKPWRVRDEEFEDRTVTRAALIEKWEHGWHALFTALDALSDDDLSGAVAIRGQPLRIDRALLRSLAHTVYHVGQIVYLAKVLRGDAWINLSIPRGGSQAYNRKPIFETASAHADAAAAVAAGANDASVTEVSRAGDRAWISDGLDERASAALGAGLPPTQLWSLLLGVMEQRAARRNPSTLMTQWERDGFTSLASIDQRTLVALDAHLLAATSAFEAVELSPLAPLGSCSVVGLASQNKVVSALRGTEVVSDPTNVLALECARRLRKDPTQVVRLATCHRCVRAQEVPKQPGFAPHFRIFCLASAAREQPDHAFVVSALVEHMTTALTALDRLEQHGYAFPDRTVKVLATRERAALGDRIAAGVQGAIREELDHPYYDGLRFQISARTVQGAAVLLIDGGAFDWVAKLASNRRLVFVATGMGSQLAAYLYRAI